MKKVEKIMWQLAWEQYSYRENERKEGFIPVERDTIGCEYLGCKVLLFDDTSVSTLENNTVLVPIDAVQEFTIGWYTENYHTHKIFYRYYSFSDFDIDTKVHSWGPNKITDAMSEFFDVKLESDNWDMHVSQKYKEDGSQNVKIGVYTC